jgi:zinc protease
VRRALLTAALAAAALGCEPPPAAVADALGPKPALATPKSFDPPAPEMLKAPNGMTVWLLERHSLPIVSAMLVIPSGSSSDPKGKAGLAFITADMLDEGAGARSAVELSSAVNDLGATLSTGASLDGSFVSLTVLKKNFGAAFAIFGDVTARPRFAPDEWKRVSELWRNDLSKRPQEPIEVARVVMASALYGRDAPYGHVPDGFVETAAAIDLDAVKAFYAESWRPDRATLAVAGDLTKDELMSAIGSALGGWKAPPEPPKGAPPAPAETRSDRPRLVLVDRPDAPQSVVAVIGAGVRASDPRAPLLDMINDALGGSFTSRLNQNLREDHGWTYGAGSSFTETRGLGSFVARAAVVTEATGPALKEMLGELEKMASAGMTPEEIEKVRAQDRAELVQAYETVNGISRRLGTLAILGLPPSFDAAASRARQRATPADLAALTASVDPKKATIVVVGPRAAASAQLAPLALGEPQLWDPEGRPVTDGGAPKPPARAGDEKKPPAAAK